MVCCRSASILLVGLVEGLDRLLQDGLHPRPPLLPQAHGPRRTTESAVRSLSAKTRVSSRLMPGARVSSARSMRRLPCPTRDSGTCSRIPATRSAWGSTTTMASWSRPSRLLLELVGDDVVHQGGLAHAGCGPRRGGGGAAGPRGKRMGWPVPAVVSPTNAPALTLRAGGNSAREPERSTRGVSSRFRRAGATERRLRGLPSTLRFPNSPGPAGWRLARGTRGFTPETLNLRPGGVVVVAVGGGHRLQDFPGPLLRRAVGQLRRRPQARRRRRRGPPSP